MSDFHKNIPVGQKDEIKHYIINNDPKFKLLQTDITR